MVGAGIDAGTVVEGAGMRWERRVASAVNGTAQFRASITLEITDFDWQCLISIFPQSTTVIVSVIDCWSIEGWSRAEEGK